MCIRDSQRSPLQQRTILDAAPPSFNHRAYLMTGQIALEPPRHALVKQHTHRILTSALLLPVPRWLARASRSENRRGTQRVGVHLQDNRSTPAQALAFPQTPAYRQAFRDRYG